jgi:hypothetical protein
MRQPFPSGAVVLSIDTEHIWGYLDQLSEAAFRQRFPAAIQTQDTLLAKLLAAGLSATWFVVGGMALRECAGTRDPRVSALPARWIKAIPEGRESSAGLWYRPSFVRRLMDARPLQEIGLHGGLTHLIWTDLGVSRQIARHELTEGIRALEELGVRPRTFSFARTQEAHLTLLAAHGLRGYRGGISTLAWQLGSTLPGIILRACDEWFVTAPPLAHPAETLRGLWNVPASMFFYPLRQLQGTLVPARTRLERFRKGVEFAARSGAIFHFAFHPENLAESPEAPAVFDDIFDYLTAACQRLGIEVLTMNDVISRMERDHLCSTKAVTPMST